MAEFVVEACQTFAKTQANFYQLSIGTSSVRQTDFNLIGGNFEAKIFQDTGSPEKSLVATLFFLTFMQAVAYHECLGCTQFIVCVISQYKIGVCK